LVKDFPKYYSWTNKRWKRRSKKCVVVARLYNAHPNQGERYYLRRLLLCRPGATSYEDLCSIPISDDNGIRVDVTNKQTRFRMACKALGLLKDDAEWKLCLEEAHACSSGNDFFISFIIYIW